MSATECLPAPPGIGHQPPLRHLYFGPAVTGVGEVRTALCGHRARVVGVSGGEVVPGRDRCVVCVSLARARGWQG